jgi:aminocarboxymuconate-semialdehyde decarboxylase
VAAAIDVHAHVIVPELLRDAAPDEPWRPALHDGGVQFGGRMIGSMVHGCVDLEQILATEAQLGIGAVLLSPWVPLLFYDIDADEGLSRCRLQNQGLAQLSGERACVLGAVPLQDPRLAAEELARLMSDGSFAGVEITASVNGVYLGDPRFEPFWDAAEQYDPLIFVHPTTRGFPGGVFDQHYLWNLVGNPFETTVAAAHMVLSGTIARHPRLRVLLAHGGGALTALSGRIRHGQAAVAGAGPAANDPIAPFLFDTITHDPALLRALVDAVGADRVLLGSDYPFDMADPDPVATVRAAGLTPEAEHAVLAGNAQRELRLGGDG